MSRPAVSSITPVAPTPTKHNILFSLRAPYKLIKLPYKYIQSFTTSINKYLKNQFHFHFKRIYISFFTMPRNKNCAKRAWNVLRLAMLWTRKGNVFKRRLAMELRLVPKYLKSLGHAAPRDQIHYGERELSFDDTPIFNVKMHRPASMRFLFPCISADAVDFDYDFGDDYGYDSGRKSFLQGKHEEDEELGGEDEVCEEKGAVVTVEEEEIDLRAEEFIEKFYAQMKLQRQVSYLQYTEMLNRGVSC